jgi:hypothetical protein
MILDHRKYKDINFSKYKRVFIFGCSFTGYHSWPTWAGVISLECKNAEIYDTSQTGGGNLFIAANVAAVNQKFKFNKDDLVLLMWSTHCREDRYRDDAWITPGNIYSQNIISEDFVKEWADVKGYIVRDLALMSLTRNMLQNLPCDAITLRSVDPNYDSDKYMQMGSIANVVDLYRDVVYDTAPPLYEFVKDGNGGWINGHEYWWPTLDKNRKFRDYHPNTKMYMNYLLSIDFKFSEETKNLVNLINDELLKLDHTDVIREWRVNIYRKYFPHVIEQPYII